MLTTMPDETLLSTLRELPPEREPSDLAVIAKELAELNNHLDDIKRKLDVSNELQITYQSWLRDGNRSDSASRARPIRNVPRPTPIRRWTGNSYD